MKFTLENILKQESIDNMEILKNTIDQFNSNLNYERMEQAIKNAVESTDSLNVFYKERPFADLDKRTQAGGQKTIKVNSPKEDYDYFITLAFPNRNVKYNTFKSDYWQRKDILGNWEWCELSQNNQYKFICHKINHCNSYFKKLHLFFEQTKHSEVHVHMRVSFNEIHNKKDVKTFFHDIFKIHRKYIHFCDIKIYKGELWHEYEKKKSKNYQTLNFKPIIY